MPTINGMAAIGLVSLPGMMTGQILAGVEPIDAVKYQLLIMFLIADTGRRHRRRTSAHGS
jgi:putative ABC transport system permease protein